MKTFKEYLIESGTFSDIEIWMMNENLKSELTEDEEKKVDEAVKKFCEEYVEKSKGLKEFNEEHELRKLESKETYFQIENFYVCHVFDNPIRTGAQPSVTQFEIFAKPTGMVHPQGGLMI